jgi:hypothetical protein
MKFQRGDVTTLVQKSGMVKLSETCCNQFATCNLCHRYYVKKKRRGFRGGRERGERERGRERGRNKEREGRDISISIRRRIRHFFLQQIRVKDGPAFG